MPDQCISCPNLAPCFLLYIYHCRAINLQYSADAIEFLGNKKSAPSFQKDACLPIIQLPGTPRAVVRPFSWKSLKKLCTWPPKSPSETAQAVCDTSQSSWQWQVRMCFHCKDDQPLATCWPGQYSQHRSQDRIFCMHYHTPSTCSSYAPVHQLFVSEQTYNTFCRWYTVSILNNFNVTWNVNSTLIAEQVTREVLARSRPTLCQQSARMAKNSNFLRRIRVISLEATTVSFVLLLILRSHVCDVS